LEKDDEEVDALILDSQKHKAEIAEMLSFSEEDAVLLQSSGGRHILAFEALI
jgi:hypothetical protein